MIAKSKILEEVGLDVYSDSNKLMRSIDKELESIKYKSFGKVKENKKSAISDEINDLEKEKYNWFTQTR